MSDSVRIETADASAFAEFGLVGGGIRQYRCCDRDIVPLDTETARRAWFSGTTLAPWPNRLADGTWTADGVQYEGECNDSRGHALHGLVYNVAFRTVQQDRSSVTLSYDLGDDAIYPFAVRIDVEYRIDNCRLTSTLRATNLSDVRAPIALGVHPYFPYTDDTSIVLNATVYNENSERLIPTGALRPISELGLAVAAENRLGDLSLDHCFSNSSRDGAGRAVTELRYPDGSSVGIWQDAQLEYTQIFTKRDFPWATGPSGAIGIEPQSAPANALNSGVDLRWLEPGDSFALQWGIEVATP